MRIPALNRHRIEARPAMPEIVQMPLSSTYIEAPDTQAAPARRSALPRVLFGLALAVFCAALLAALASYDPRDPSFSFASSIAPRNLLGVLGSYASDIAFFVLGFTAYALAVSGVLAGIIMLFRPAGLLRRALRTAAFVLTLCGLAAAENLRFAYLSAYLPGEAGGALGQLASGVLTSFLGSREALAVSVLVTLAGARLAFGFSYLRVFEFLGRGVEAFFGFFLVRRPRAGYVPTQDIVREEEPEGVGLVENEPLPPVQPRAPAPVSPKIVVEQRATRTVPQPLEQTASLFPEKTMPLPDIRWLDKPVGNGPSIDAASLKIMSTLIENKLASFGVRVQVVKVRPGPVVTLYEIELAEGLKSASIVNLGWDLARVLAVASVRILETVPGTSHMGIEVPNPSRQTVKLSEIIDSDLYRQEQGLPLCLGKRITGEPFVTDLRKLPHLLVAGTTGSGKSVGVNAMLLSLIYRYTPDKLKFILVDPKQVEFSLYEAIPHLICPVVTDMKKASRALEWCVREMERRYRMASLMKTRSIYDYNKRVHDFLSKGKKRVSDVIPDTKWDYDLVEEPYIVVVVDELADLLMMDKKGVEDSLIRLAQKARAASIHLILATQRPSADIISGLLRTNIPSRMAFQVATASDSRIILDMTGAETLLGKGDALFKSASVGVPERVQVPFVPDEELTRVTRELRALGEPEYVEGILEGEDDEEEGGSGGVNGGQLDPLLDRAVQIVVENGKCSITMLQRRLGVGYPRAANIVDQMEAQGIVTKPDASGRRTILAKME